MRLRNIDLLKGILILLVIIGHILQGTFSENIWRYIIYTFHMPLFIGISGYLLNYTKIGQLNFTDLFKKYFFRVIFPWAIAVIVYLLADHYKGLSIKSIPSLLGNAFLLPYYHLWFIAAFLSWILIAWLSKKIKLPLQYLLAISFFISVGSYILQQYPVYKGMGTLSDICDVILYTFRPFYLIFFVTGMYLRANSPKVNVPVFSGIIALLFAFNIYLFFHPILPLIIALYFVFNLFALCLLLELANKNRLPFNKVLEWIGVNSLGIYLWHLLPILILKKVINPQHKLIEFYLAAFITEAIFIVIIWQLSRIKLLNKYVLGMS